MSLLLSKYTNWNLSRKNRASNNAVIPNQSAFLVWESPSKSEQPIVVQAVLLHCFPDFIHERRYFYPGDCHARKANWLAMTGNSIPRGKFVLPPVPVCATLTTPPSQVRGQGRVPHRYDGEAAVYTDAKLLVFILKQLLILCCGADFFLSFSNGNTSRFPLENDFF